MAMVEGFTKSRCWNNNFWTCVICYWVTPCNFNVDIIHIWLLCVVGMGTASLGEKAWMGLSRSYLPLKKDKLD